jgi:hypothetical protein
MPALNHIMASEASVILTGLDAPRKYLHLPARKYLGLQSNSLDFNQGIPYFRLRNIA